MDNWKLKKKQSCTQNPVSYACLQSLSALVQLNELTEFVVQKLESLRQLLYESF